jgi:hypothetical protein
LLLQFAFERERRLERDFAPVCTARLIRPTARDALFGVVNRRAYSKTCAMNCSPVSASKI